MLDAAEIGIGRPVAGRAARVGARRCATSSPATPGWCSAATDRAVAELADAARRRRHGAGSTQAAVLSGMLALSGLASENMVRDPGWYFMDLGRRMERAQQVTALLRSTLTRSHSSAVDSLVVESVLAASESGRHLPAPVPRPDPGRDHARAAAAGRRQPAVAGLPGGAGPGRPAGPARLVRHVAAAAPAGGRGRASCAAPARRIWTGRRRRRPPGLLALLDGLHESLRGIADAIAAQHFWHPSPMQPVGVVTLRTVG